MKELAFLLLILAIAGCSQVTDKSRSTFSANYPSPLPIEQSLTFLPGVVSDSVLNFNAAFSPDGNTFYFSRSKNRKYIIYETHFEGNKWNNAQPSSLFDTLYSNTDPFITNDGSIYFISSRPKDASDTIDDYDIYKLPKGASGYEKPVNLSDVNSDSTEYYVSLSENGNIYFASYRSGNLDLYYSKANNPNGYSKPEILTALNSTADEHDPFIAADESYIVFTSSRPGGFGEADLYISRKVDGNWQQPVNMGDKINNASYDYCPYVTPDGKFFFYSSDNDVKWVDAKVITASHP
ncbi:MAG TPA: hypothetical protein VFE50_11240 [Cyclobacteriaceae bacterium]|nr:hypothetical protein [Cyclobacteriaceae bacterium]